MLNENFVILGGAIAGLGTIKYIIDTVKGKIKPNKVTFFLLPLGPLIAFVAENKQGVGMQSLLTFWVGFSPMLIFIASFFNKKAVWKLGKFDFLCGALSLIGLFLWYITKVGNVAIAFGILADGFALLPTIVKTYNFPKTENGWMWLAGSIGAIFTILTIKDWTFATSAFPVYILLSDLIIFFLAQINLGKILLRSIR